MKRSSRREFTKSTPAAVLAEAECARASNEEAVPARPNILLIVDDQHNPRAMSWTGECEVETPSLDRLAAESVCFLNGYASSPVCAPARHTIYTGLYASEHGCIFNDVPMRDVPTIAKHLNEAGYTTANIGKMHNAPFHERRDFQYVLYHEFFRDPFGISHYAPFLAHELKKRGLPTPHNWLVPMPGKRTWLEHPETLAFVNELPEDLTAERWTTDESLKFIREQLKERPGKPFFLHVGYFPPHMPYAPIEKYAKRYDPAALRLPPNFNRKRLDQWCAGGSHPDHLSDEEVKYLRALYFGFTTQLDAEIGRLLQGLEDLGVANNTVVIFVSDHGDMIGEQGLFYKGFMYEGSVRVPFMIRWPGVHKPRRESALVSHADIAPTILRAAGLDPGSDLPGADLRPLLAGEPDWPERAVYSEFLQRLPFVHLMLRRGDHKLIASTRGADERDDIRLRLFDVANDPWELHDLANDPESAPILAALKDELMAQWEKQRRFMPDEMPPFLPHLPYDLPWPADPWQPVLPP